MSTMTDMTNEAADDQLRRSALASDPEMLMEDARTYSEQVAEAADRGYGPRMDCPFCEADAYRNANGVWECDFGHTWRDWAYTPASGLGELRYRFDAIVLWIANATGLIHPTRRVVEWLARQLDRR